MRGSSTPKKLAKRRLNVNFFYTSSTVSLLLYDTKFSCYLPNTLEFSPQFPKLSENPLQSKKKKNMTKYWLL